MNDFGSTEHETPRPEMAGESAHVLTVRRGSPDPAVTGETCARGTHIARGWTPNTERLCRKRHWNLDMCGRFTLRTPLNVLVEQFQLADAEPLPLRFNVAPMQPIAVVRREPEGSLRRLSLVRWGLVPSWAKDASFGARMINARAESVADKPTFRSAFKYRRCLVPADGYYEWQKAGSRKQPFYIRRADDRPFAIAGLWETWRAGDNPDGLPLQTCTLITTEANDLTRPLHDRMPVILDADDFDVWLDSQLQDRLRLEPLLRPYDSREMVACPVSTYVNNVLHDGPQCMAIQRELF